VSTSAHWEPPSELPQAGELLPHLSRDRRAIDPLSRRGATRERIPIVAGGRLRRLVPPPLKRALRNWLLTTTEAVQHRFLERPLSRWFLARLIRKTGNFSGVTWLGQPVWQNVLDLWIIQEAIFEISPGLLIECGTNRGGSAYFYASLFDLMGRGDVFTVDVTKMHNISHPRIEFAIGSSVSETVATRARERAQATQGPVMVILDSDHSEGHVFQELEIYASLVTPGSFLLVQDGVIDALDMLRGDRPGPLPAIRRFLAHHDEFEVDDERCHRFLVTHHPSGWLRRK
jgi:cephalosporin hydroxylase